MQRNNPVDLHKSKKLFLQFEYDMEILPSYTPIFMIDGRGRIIESRKMSVSGDGCLSIIPEVCESDRSFFVSAHNSCDAFAVEARFGDGKDFIVVSKDESGLSRCVVCSLSDNNCMHLHEYYEKLSCYKDYLDSFSSLVFSSVARIPVLRMFRTRINGTAELMRLSEGKGGERVLTFPFAVAAEKLCNVAKALNRGTDAAVSVETGRDEIVISAPESFFKLALCLIAYGLRCSRDGAVIFSAKEVREQNAALISLSANFGPGESKMYRKALSCAFERAGFPFSFTQDKDRATFSFVAELADEREKILSDSVVMAQEIATVLSQQDVLDMYLTVADI